MRAARILLAAGALQAALGLARALADTKGSSGSEGSLHVVLLARALGFVALALVLALLPAFTGRETTGAPLAWLAAASFPVVDALAVLTHILPPNVLALPLLLALPLPLLRGPALRSPARPLAAGQPHRVGDRAALAALLAGCAGLLVGALLLAWMPRGLPVAGIAFLVLGGCLPIAAGVLAFLLPRLAARPFPGTTLLYAAGGALLLSTLGLAAAFVFPWLGGFRNAAAGVVLAHALALAAFLRVELPAREERAAHARPLLRGAAVLSPLAALVLLLALLADRPSDLLPVAAYAHLALAALALGAALAFAAPFLGMAPSRGPGRSKVAAALLVAGLFLLAPAFQYPYSAFPGAAVLAAGALFLAVPFLGGEPLRTRKR